MKSFAAVLFLGAFLAVIGMLEGTIKLKERPRRPYRPPGPHEVHTSCRWTTYRGEHIRPPCLKTCQTLDDPTECIRMCEPGNICIRGYIREYEDGPCIRLSECPITAVNV